MLLAGKGIKPRRIARKLANVERRLHDIDVRFEMEASKPMGFATYQTVGKIRNARIRNLTADEIKAEAKSTDDN